MGDLLPTSGPLAITGWSAVNALGTSRAAISESLYGGASGLRSCPLELPFTTFCGTVGDEMPPLPSKYQDYECRQARLALGIYQGVSSAVDTALKKWGNARVALILATSTGGIAETETALQVHRRKGHFPAHFQMERQHNFYAHCRFLKMTSGIGGPSFVISTACSSSTKVFASARRMIAADVVDAVLVGGIDSLCLTTLHGFHSLGILSDQRCKPFSGERKGLSIGEGGALLLLEREGESAVSLLGCAETSDAHHMSSPHPEGLGAILAMKQALEESGLSPQEIGHINAHGTGTLHNDASEARAVAEVFGRHVPVVSTKGYTGHMLGAAGATEAVFACMALEDQRIPKSLGADPVDEAIEMQVNQKQQERVLKTVASNSFGFGGSNACAVFGANS
ncbi:MAG: beta-ketoacyl-ACP synthase [Myxococcales bacterium]|nr:beta-ketoacyl-ACP synthase [Myxococcales bacterium]